MTEQIKEFTNDESYYEITLSKETACLILKKGNELVDTLFINQLSFDLKTTGELLEEAKVLAKKNNITEYAINLH
jgi:hypothetical protein